MLESPAKEEKVEGPSKTARDFLSSPTPPHAICNQPDMSQAIHCESPHVREEMEAKVGGGRVKQRPEFWWLLRC